MQALQDQQSHTELVRVTTVSFGLESGEAIITIKSNLDERELGKWLRKVPVTARGFSIVKTGDQEFEVTYPKQKGQGILRDNFFSNFMICKDQAQAYSWTLGPFIELISPGRLHQIFFDAQKKIIESYYKGIDEGDINFVLNLFGQSDPAKGLRSYYNRAGEEYTDLEIDLFYKKGRKIKITHTIEETFWSAGKVFVRGSFNGIGADGSKRSGRFADCWEFSEDESLEDLHVESRFTFLNGVLGNSPPRVRDLIRLEDLYISASKDNPHIVYLPKLDENRIVIIQKPKDRDSPGTNEGWVHIWERNPKDKYWYMTERFESSGASYVRE